MLVCVYMLYHRELEIFENCTKAYLKMLVKEFLLVKPLLTEIAGEFEVFFRGLDLLERPFARPSYSLILHYGIESR